MGKFTFMGSHRKDHNAQNYDRSAIRPLPALRGSRRPPVHLEGLPPHGRRLLLSLRARRSGEGRRAEPRCHQEAGRARDVPAVNEREMIDEAVEAPDHRRDRRRARDQCLRLRGNVRVSVLSFTMLVGF